MGIKMFYDYEVVDAVRKLSAESAKVKNEIFKSTIMKRGINDDILKSFISYINSFLKQWDEHCADLAREMAKSSGTENIRTLDYAFAKDYIYADYDYAAILQFTDGIVKGVTSGKFSEPADIEKFYSHTVNKAFDDQPDTIAGLLDSVLQQNLYNTSEVVTDKYQSRMYDTIKKYKNIYEPNNRVELYKASVRTIDFIRNDFNPFNSMDYSNVKIFISAINNIIDFIVYSITAFVSRIYVISQYAGPFIRNEVRIIRESTSIESIAVTVMRDMDNSLSHDHTKVNDLIETFSKFVSDIGADKLFDGKPQYGSYLNDKYKDSKFCTELMSNQLMIFICNRDKLQILSMRYLSSSSINMLNNTLKSLVFNQYQGINGMATAKQEIMHVIRGVGNDINTIKDAQELGKGLYIFVLTISKNIEDIICDLFSWKENEINTHNLSDISKVSECIKILGELYRDIMSASVERARDIESKYNMLSSNEMDKIHDEVSIKVPGNNSKPIDTTSNISNVVPDTMRMPMNLMDIYSLPAFESAMMYDDFLRSLPEFESSYYLNESVISDVINALMAFLDGIRRKIDNFFSNKSVKSSINWVKEHRNELDAITFSDDDSMSNTIMFKEKITLPEGYNNLIKGIKDFDESKAVSGDSISAFIKSLYPNETIYKWFTSDDTKDKAAKMFQILFLMNVTIDEINSKKLTELPVTTIKGAEYQRNFKMWVETVAHGYDVYEQYKKIDDELRKDIKDMKNKIVQISSKQQEKKDDGMQTVSTTGTTATGGNTSGEKKDENVVDKTKQPEVKIDGNKTSTDSTSNIMSQVHSTVKNIWEPIGKLMCNSIQKQYKYLRDTYTAKKNQTSNTNANSNQ